MNLTGLMGRYAMCIVYVMRAIPFIRVATVLCCIVLYSTCDDDDDEIDDDEGGILGDGGIVGNGDGRWRWVGVLSPVFLGILSSFPAWVVGVLFLYEGK